MEITGILRGSSEAGNHKFNLIGVSLTKPSGRVLDANARPIAGVRIEIWQCDANGVYLHPGDRRRDSRDASFQGFGHAIADSAGRFAFRTIVPVP